MQHKICERFQYMLSILSIFLQYIPILQIISFAPFSWSPNIGKIKGQNWTKNELDFLLYELLHQHICGILQLFLTEMHITKTQKKPWLQKFKVDHLKSLSVHHTEIFYQRNSYISFCVASKYLNSIRVFPIARSIFQ